MITYTWKVTGIRTATVDDLDDFVVHVRWEKTGTDEMGNTGTFIGATPLKETVGSDGLFIPFAELTEEVVIGWIQEIVVGSYGAHVDKQIQKQIDTKAHAVSEPSLPWAPPEPEPVSVDPNNQPAG